MSAEAEGKLGRKRRRVSLKMKMMTWGEDVITQEPHGGVPDETPQQFFMRVQLYVAVHLSRAPNSKRDHYKDALVYQARKNLISEFLKATLLRKCQNSDCSR